MGSWETVSLGDVVEIFDGPHATPKKTSTGPIFLGISNLVRGRIDLSETEHIAEDDFARWTRRVTPQHGDVVFSYETRLGEAAIVPAGLRCCLGRRMGLLRTVREKADPRFVLYGYLGPFFQEVIRQRTIHGSTVDRIPLIEMAKFPFVLPPLSEQKAIAGLLGALDDKIDLNRRMCETLETIGRVLFRSWFVDFTPVTGSAEVQDLIDARVADMFPAEIDASSRVPRGWTRQALGEWVDALSGGTPSKSDPSLWGGDIAWISPKVMTEIHADITDEYVTLAALGNGTRLAPSGSTLVMVRGMGLHKSVRVSQARSSVAFNQDVKALVPKGIEPSLLLFALLNGQQELLGKVESSGHGTGKLPSEILFSHSIVMPPRETQAKLARTFDLLGDRIASARAESRALAELRDVLLPGLLAGEVRCPDVSRQFEAVR